MSQPLPGAGLPPPAPSELGAPFWDACAEGRLTVPECSRCHVRFFVPEAVCPRCWSADWTWSESPGRGVLYSATAVYRAPAPDVAVPYVIAVVELDDGWTMMSQLLGVPPADVRLGVPVKVTFRNRDGVALPYFVPVDADGA